MSCSYLELKHQDRHWHLVHLYLNSSVVTLGCLVSVGVLAVVSQSKDSWPAAQVIEVVQN